MFSKVFKTVWLYWYIGIIITLIFIGCVSYEHNSDNNDETIPIEVENVIPYGMSTFALGVDNFPREEYLNIAKKIRHVATNELWLFPEHNETEIQNKKYFLQQLLEHGNLVTHQIHILNGPGLRSAEGDLRLKEKFGYVVDDEILIEGLFSDPKFRNGINEIFIDVIKYARELETMGVHVFICPELEDNHESGENHNSYAILLNLLNSNGWPRTKTFRNPNSPIIKNRIDGIHYELHPHSWKEFTVALTYLRANDFINTDGNSFTFTDDKNFERASSPTLIPQSDIEKMLKLVAEQRIISYVWQAEMQGYKFMNGVHKPFPSLQQRNYIIDQPKDIEKMLLENLK